MIWDVFVLRIFTQYFFKEDNFTELSKQSLTYQKANNVLLNNIDKDKQNIELLKVAIKNNLQTIQFCYSTLYSKIMQEQTHLEFKIKQNLILFIANGKIIKMHYCLFKHL